MSFTYRSISELVEEASKQGQTISALVLSDQAAQAEQSEEALFEIMQKSYEVMRESVAAGIDKNLRSTSGLTGGTAYLMKQSLTNGSTLCGSVFGNALVRALAVSEYNAAMGKIVAAPTAGSCGILPAAILTLQEERQLSDHDCIMSMFTASAVGMVIANQACIAGAQGGCQAECGSAAAMAAAALVELAKGTPDMISHSIAIALKNVLGLVCDPVAGLVEIPCIKRNASGVTNALTSAELALAGITSAIPADEVIIAMKRVGDSMSSSLKETAEGGLAATPTAKKLYEQVFGDNSLQ